MKFNKIALFAAMTLSLSGVSCSDYLDKEVDLTLQADVVFGDYDMTRGFQARLYGYLPDAFAGYTNGQYRAASRDCMTDNCVSFWNVHQYNLVLLDGYQATNHPFANDYWSGNYRGIRACNQFLLNARSNVIGNAEKPGDDNRLYDRWIAETRVIRTILHYDLVTWFGDVPVVGDDENGTPVILSPGMELPGRTKGADVLKWIADECEAYKNDLPFRYSNEEENWGRVNGAAAYALKAKALILRASPLYNPEGNRQLWQEAADAALDFIRVNAQQPNPYRLYTTADNDPKQNYYQCFVDNPVLNPEYILSRSVWTTHEIENFLAPCGFSGTANAVGRTNPTQNLVDSYETINGLPIDQDPAYDDQHPYDNRDPRLEQTILHHGSIWGDSYSNEERMVDITYGEGIDYKQIHGGTLTGYYTKKFLNNMSWSNPTNYRHACPIFRYADILLIAAEALNEAGSTGQAYQYVNEVRARVGMPPYSGMDQNTLRERIRNERRVELCFEDQRFIDERRWKVFEGVTRQSEASQPRYKQIYNLYGVTIHPDEATVYQYGPADTYPYRVVNTPKNYYFPIPHNECVKAGLPQTPGWEL